MVTDKLFKVNQLNKKSYTPRVKTGSPLPVDYTDDVGKKKEKK